MARNSIFLLFFLIFTTTTATSRVPPYTIHPSDLSALHEIKNSLTELPSLSSPSFLSSWNFTDLSDNDPCSTFAGVTCSLSKRVTILALGTGLSGSLGLSGTLSRAISRLTDLTQLILYAGFVTGPIPSELGSLRKLRVLSLTNNRLTGPIPASIFSLPSLHTLDLSHNHLTGTVTPFISAAWLRVLVLAGNKLYGKLPTTFPDGLLHLDLSSNFFNGVLPSSNLPYSLRYLSVSNNRLWGPLNGLDQVRDLSYLDLSMNGFSGQIPPELFDRKIASLFLQRNNLSGGLPMRAALGDESTFRMGPTAATVDLSHNRLTGVITTTFVDVETLFLNNNALTGDVPEEYVESVKSGAMKTLYLQHNYLTGFPLAGGDSLPDTASVCVSYNCMEAPPDVAVAACPASAGSLVVRPAYQCARVRNGRIYGDSLD